MKMIYLILILGGIAVLGGTAIASGAALEGGKTFLFWTRYDSNFKAAAARWGIDWHYLKATAIVESTLGQNPSVITGTTSTDGKSWGLMQFTLPTANDMCPIQVGTKVYASISIADLNVPEVSIELAAKYISRLIKLFPGDLRKAIISYNQGPGNTQKGRDFTGDYWKKWYSALQLVNKG